MSTTATKKRGSPPLKKRFQEIVPEENDVLLARNQRQHAGNVKFRRLVKERLIEYLFSTTKDMICRQIVEEIAEDGGRFLKNPSKWELASRGMSIRGVKQMFEQYEDALNKSKKKSQIIQAVESIQLEPKQSPQKRTSRNSPAAGNPSYPQVFRPVPFRTAFWENPRYAGTQLLAQEHSMTEMEQHATGTTSSRLTPENLFGMSISERAPLSYLQFDGTCTGTCKTESPRQPPTACMMFGYDPVPELVLPPDQTQPRRSRQP